MALEGKDFDDQTIMRATSQEDAPSGNGAFRLKIKMPLSGREVSSEWISQDKRKQALFAWVNVVRAEAQADAERHEQERKEAARAARAKQSPIVAPDGAALSPYTDGQGQGATPSSGSAAAAAQSAPAPAAYSASTLTSNPDEYVAQQLKAALVREAQSEVAFEAAASEQNSAKINLAKWQKLHDTLKGV